MPAMIEEKKEKEEKKVASKTTVTKKRGLDKWKKKSWYSIFTPEEFDKTEIGTTVSEKPELVMGRMILVNAAQVSRQPKFSHISLHFKVDSVQGQKAFTKLVGFEVSDSYLRRIVRRRTTKIEAVTDIVTKDGQKARVKIVTVSAIRLTQTQAKSIRKILVEELEKASQSREFKLLAQEMIFGSLATVMVKRAKKIAAIKRTEIVKCQSEPDQKKQ